MCKGSNSERQIFLDNYIILPQADVHVYINASCYVTVDFLQVFWYFPDYSKQFTVTLTEFKGKKFQLFLSIKEL